jgi:Tfp pilus assembly protein PilF
MWRVRTHHNPKVNMRKYFLFFLILFFLVGCHKKPKPFEPPPETPPPTIEQPAPAPPTPTPAPTRPPMEAPPPKPRSASPGDKASIHLVEAGTKQMNAGNLDDAEQTFEQALRVSPTNGRPYYYLGVIASKQKNYDRGLSFLSQAETYLNDDSFWMSQVYLQEGLIYKDLNQKDNALQKFQDALKSDPTNQWAQNELKKLQ